MPAASLHRDPDSEFEGSCVNDVIEPSDSLHAVETERIVADEENLLQTIPANSQEAVVSCLSLHWVNDLPGLPILCNPLPLTPTLTAIQVP